MSEVKARDVAIDVPLCVQCGNCVRLCPMGVFDMVAGNIRVARPEKCIACDLCTKNCPVNAITVTPMPVAAPAVSTPSPAESPPVSTAPAAPPPAPTTPTAPPAAAVAPAVPSMVPRHPPTSPPTYPYFPHLVPPEKIEQPKEAPLRLSPEKAVLRWLVAFSGICVGCQMCELACSLSHHGILNPFLARIRVTAMKTEGRAEPTICHHCRPAPCEIACPTGALFRAPNLPNVLLVDDSKCIKCYACAQACPYGATQVGPGGEILKCDLCGGNPVCVQVCQERPEFRPTDWTGGKVSCLQYLSHEEITSLRRFIALKGGKR
jgi:Fe-S-cluster-containing hydrogenase component 2